MEVLTAGAIQALISKKTVESPIVVQVLDITTIDIRHEPRLLITISDGSHSLNDCLLPKQMAKLFTENTLGKYSILNITRGTPVQIDEKVYFLIKSGKPINGATTEKIGTPSPLCEVLLEPNGLDEVMEGCCQIKDVNHFSRNVSLCARVTSKSDLSSWNNSKGSGKYINLHIRDSTGEIVLTAFNKAAEVLQAEIVDGKVYSFRNVDGKFDTMKTLNTTSKIVFDVKSVVKEEPSFEEIMPTVSGCFSPIVNITNFPPGVLIDVMGICTSIGDATKLHKRDSREEILKKEITIADQTKKSINVAVWGKIASSLSVQAGDIIVITRCKVSSFGKKSLSLTGVSKLLVNPVMNEVAVLRSWFNQNGATSFQNLSMPIPEQSKSYSFLCDIDTDAEDKEINEVEFFRCKATIISANTTSILYYTCSNRACTKKLKFENSGYFCTSCLAEVSSPVPNLFLQMAIQDDTDIRTVVAFTSLAEQILNKSSVDAASLLKVDENNVDNIISSVLNQEFDFELKAKVRLFKDKKLLQLEVVRACLTKEILDEQEPNPKRLKLMECLK